MRIIAGKWKGRVLETFRGRAIRPTTDRVREALFSALASALMARQKDWEGLRVLDLYAGTGALGLEALSRGAAFLVAVDEDRGAARLVERNARLLGAAGEVRVVSRPVEKWLSRLPVAGAERFDLILADPPYGTGAASRVLDLLPGSARVAPGALVVVERGAREPSLPRPAAMERLFARTYGDTAIEIFEEQARE